MGDNHTNPFTLKWEDSDPHQEAITWDIWKSEKQDRNVCFSQVCTSDYLLLTALQ
jgi:hypothetical protein